MKASVFVKTGIVAISAALAASCASTSSFHFSCEPLVNEGLLLTIDLVQINEAEVAPIRQAGDQWFYSDLRRQLEPRIQTVAVEGRCDTTVKLAPRKGYDTLAVISDYKSTGSSAGTLQIRQKQEWKGKTLQVKVGATTLSIQGGR